MNSVARGREAAVSAPPRHGAGPVAVARATATLLAALAVLVAVTLAQPHLAARARSPLAAKLADAERVAYYQFGTDAGPRFRVGPGDRSIKLITHLLLPADTPYDPQVEARYGVVVIVRDLAGNERWRRVVELRARQSKAGGDRSGWRYENAFLLGDEGQLADDRLTRIHLPPATEDQLVELRLAPRDPAAGVMGLARVYVRRARPIDERALQELSLSASASRALIGHLTVRAWDQLSADERRVKLGQVWERLAAEGEPGRAYQTLGVYETGFRLPPGAGEGSPPLEVDRWRSLAVNVIGPAELLVRGVDERAAARLQIRRIGLDGREHAYPPATTSERSLVIPPGIHTVVVEAPQPILLELAAVRGEAESVWLVEAARPRSDDPDGHERLQPDRRRIEVVELPRPRSEPLGGGGGPAPRWAVAGPADAATRTFRFDVRVVAERPSAWWSGEAPTPAVELCFFAADERALGCERWVGQPAVASAFEGVRDPARPGATSEAERWRVVSEPQAVRAIAPPTAASVELRPVPAQVGAAPGGAAQFGPGPRLLVRGYGLWPQLETRVARPFDDPPGAGVRWRYAPLVTRTWFPIRPQNAGELAEAGLVQTLLAQVRLERRPGGGGVGPGHAGSRWWRGDPDFDDRLADALAGADGWDPGPWVSLDPRGRHRRRTVLERLDPEAGRRLARRWDSSLFCRLVPGQGVTVDLHAAGPGPAQLHWRVDPAALGHAVELAIDDHTVTRILTSSRGRWRLPRPVGATPSPLQRSAIELRWSGPGRQAFWIDRPIQGGGARVYRRRVLHELRRSLVFDLTKPGIEPLTVNVVVYIPRGREQVTLRLAVDGGQPTRRAGVVEAISVASRQYTITPAHALDEHGRAVDLRSPTQVVDLAGGGPAVDVVTVPLTLGEDVAAGRHTLRVELVDAPAGAGPVWLRAFHRGRAAEHAPARQWVEREEPR